MNYFTKVVIKELMNVKNIDDREMAKRTHIPYIRFKTYLGQNFIYSPVAYVTLLAYELNVPMKFLEDVSRYYYMGRKNGKDRKGIDEGLKASC